MDKKKKVLVLGGTGAMGVYLVPELLKMGYRVDVVSLDTLESNHPDLRHIQTKDAKEVGFMTDLLKKEYHAIVDFLIYDTASFKEKHRLLLENTGHYIYLSSYRIYANEEHPIRETSPRLVDVSTDQAYLATDDYSLHKARGEDTLRASGLGNWTAIRPAITYSRRRFQLVTLEALTVINRARAGKTLVLPQEALGVQATMSWGGDVASMIVRLVLNKAAFREIYTVATAEHNPWQTVADYYHELIGLKYIAVDKETYLHMITGGGESPGRRGARWQLDYDRLFDRVIDNSKILNVTGLRQSELMPLHDGLQRELNALPENYVFPGRDLCGERMDAYLAR